jgi:hypothetical protein
MWGLVNQILATAGVMAFEDGRAFGAELDEIRQRVSHSGNFCRWQTV